MKQILVDLLLASPFGREIRDALDLGCEQTLTEAIYVRLYHISEQESRCDSCVRLAKWADKGTLSGKACDVAFRCLGVRALHYSYEQDPPAVGNIQAPLEIETGDRFLIFCNRIEVETVRPFNLSDEPL
jgi:hypothetical protein